MDDKLSAAWSDYWNSPEGVQVQHFLSFLEQGKYDGSQPIECPGCLKTLGKPTVEYWTAFGIGMAPRGEWSEDENLRQHERWMADLVAKTTPSQQLYFHIKKSPGCARVLYQPLYMRVFSKQVSEIVPSSKHASELARIGNSASDFKGLIDDSRPRRVWQHKCNACAGNFYCYGRQTKTCGRAKCEKAYRNQRARERTRERAAMVYHEGVGDYVPRACQYCGERFQPTRASQKFCPGGRCRVAAHRRNAKHAASS